MYKIIKNCVCFLLFICFYTFHILVQLGYRMLKVHFMDFCAPCLTIVPLSQLPMIYFIFFLIPIRKCTVKHFGSFPVILLSQFPFHLHIFVLFHKIFLDYVILTGKEEDQKSPA